MISDLKSAIKNDDYDTIKSLSKSVQETLMEVGKKVYESNPSTDSKTSSDSVIDADFSETK